MARPPGIDGDVYQAAQALITTRQNVSAKRLDDPGPSGAECDALLDLAAAAPDHAHGAGLTLLPLLPLLLLLLLLLLMLLICEMGACA